MRILVLTTFLDGRDRFVEGDTRTVDDADGQRFIDNGWAQLPGKNVDQPDSSREPVDLTPQGAAHGVEDTNG